MKAETIQARDFAQVLVTGYKRPYTESRLALTLDEVEQHKHELERLGCKNVRVLKVPI